MPFTTLTEKALQGYELGAANPTIPATHYLALIAATARVNSAVVTTGTYIYNPTFPLVAASQSVWNIFKVTTGGTLAGSAPGGYASTGAAGGTITDGTAVVTEVSVLFAAGTFTAAEPTGVGSYVREPITNNTTNWPTPTGTIPVTSQNGVAVPFPTTTASWGTLVGFVLFDAVTAGNARSWGLLTGASAVATVVGVTPTVNINGLTFTLT